MRRLLKNFIRSEDGNYVMITAITMSAFMAAVGLGINVGQLYHTQSNLRQALDAAVTSTARELTTGRITENDARPTVEKFLRTNSTEGFAAGDFNLDTLTINTTDSTVTATASADVDVAFPLFGMSKRHRVVSESAALYSDRKIEVAMMLDTTGSMGDPASKLRDLKKAATDAVTDLLQRNANSSTPRIRVALVPYAAGVNVGAMSDVIYYEGAGVTPGAPLGLSELSLPRNKALKDAIKAAKQLAGDTCATERKGADGNMDLSDSGPFDVMINRDRRAGKDERGKKVEACPSATVVPLTAEAGRLKTAIAGFKANGTTAGHIGIQWTQYVLSPKWSSFLRDTGSTGSVPADYNDPKSKKIAVLMTDGEFNTAFAGVAGAGISDESTRKSAEYAIGLCDQLKANDIEVFTIGFMLKEAGAKNTLAACASPDTGGVKHFFDASNGAELSQAFDSVTANIETVRLIN